MSGKRRYNPMEKLFWNPPSLATTGLRLPLGLLYATEPTHRAELSILRLSCNLSLLL